jgi:SAM-dependent methyltransferase
MTNYFGAEAAKHYDASTGTEFQPDVIETTVDFLEPFAEGGALEFAIGTGRIALPLAKRGVRVHGIDLSPDMVARLKEKPGGDAIPVTIGSIATERVEGTFTLVYLVFNSIMNLTSQDEQIACFQNAAVHLAPGGCFVIEVGTLNRKPLEVFALGETHVGIDEFDPATQRSFSHHFTLRDGQWRRASVPFRSVSHTELDLMARLAGMELRERWSGWNREPFTSESRKHVSVWQKR